MAEDVKVDYIRRTMSELCARALGYVNTECFNHFLATLGVDYTADLGKLAIFFRNSIMQKVQTRYADEVGALSKEHRKILRTMMISDLDEECSRYVNDRYKHVNQDYL